MENFVVSARKYRPITFDTVIGQKAITSTLKNAIHTNHLAQAFLFTGPRGVGKTTCARILAKTINCLNITPGFEPCNKCEACQTFNNGQSLNIYELDAASNNSVDDIRALVEQVRYAPVGGKYKVYIIDEVHMLSGSAFNAFLKTLEEPPPYAVFILATTEKHKIIPTILSRCQIFDFSRITVDDITNQLASIAASEGVKAERDALHMIALKADGALRDALSIFDRLVSFTGDTLTYKSVIENLHILDYDYFFRMTEQILDGNISGVLLTYAEILSLGFDGHHFITSISTHFRDLLVCRDAATVQLLEVSEGIREKYLAQSKLCNADLLFSLLEEANRCDINFRTALNQRLHVELSLLKMCALAKPSAIPAIEPKKKSSIGEGQKKEDKGQEGIPTVQKIYPPQPPVTSAVQGPKEAAPQKPVVIQPVITPKTISIKDSMRLKEDGIKDNGQEEEKAQKTEEKEGITDESYDKEAVLQQLWNSFAGDLFKQGKMSLNSAMTKRKPSWSRENDITFLVDNASLEKDFNAMKQELLDHLRKSMNGSGISLTFETVREENKTDKPYSAADKFKWLAERNPRLNEMKKLFDLDID
ncbi:MAG: DNA polymerase III subunit gamma/tau [Bacteroidia bacterium]|nr:DNA polymerase III subunit gamma/tau [Bacteroidia bacterium]